MRRSTGVLLALLLALPACGDASTEAAERDAVAAARAFLDDYVDPDGRVVRRDQGGDTVSEGQAYALLLAEVADRPEQADAVWRWARENLARPDGLLSYLADATRVRDPQAAADADLLAAWALARDDRDAGVALASAVQAEETVTTGRLRLVAAGPWATGSPAVLNPSYWSPAPYRELARLTGDDRWQAMAAEAVVATGEVTRGGSALPPDWAQAEGGTLRATGTPDGAQPPRYSLDAQRTVVWMATDCEPAARDLAAGWRPLLEQGDPAALSRGLDGRVLDPVQHPLPLVAAAAAAHADGDPGARDRLLDDAEAELAESPTYYGSAWVALGRALLQTDLLDACEESP